MGRVGVFSSRAPSLVWFFLSILMANAAAAAACSSTFYALPTVVSTSIPGGWALVASASAKAFCVRKGHAAVGARRERTLAALGKGRRTMDLATNKTCTDKKCAALVGVECVLKGAKACKADPSGNVGRGNVGKHNFGTGNVGDRNIGTDNVGFRCVGTGNRGVSLVGYWMQGALKIAPSLYGGPQSSVVRGKAPSRPLPLPAKPKAPPPPRPKSSPALKPKPPPPPKPKSCPPPRSPSPCPPCAKIAGGNPPPPKTPPTQVEPLTPAPTPPTRRPPPPPLLLPPPLSPSPARPPPPKPPARPPPPPQKCTDPCFTWDAETSSCSLTKCTDPCTDCVSDGVSEYFCVDTYGLKIHDTAEECRAAPFCDPSEECFVCSKVGYGCIQY